MKKLIQILHPNLFPLLMAALWLAASAGGVVLARTNEEMPRLFRLNLALTPFVPPAPAAESGTQAQPLAHPTLSPVLPAPGEGAPDRIVIIVQPAQKDGAENQPTRAALPAQVQVAAGPQPALEKTPRAAFLSSSSGPVQKSPPPSEMREDRHPSPRPAQDEKGKPDGRHFHPTPSPEPAHEKSHP